MQDAIVTHGDFDGIVSAALVSRWSGLNFFNFTGPESVRKIEVGPRDIVCDLPHPMRPVRAWFDHHGGNIEEAKTMGLSLGEGAAWEAPSAARVVFDHLKGAVEFPDFMEETVRSADRIDTMDYASIEDWLADSPENIVNRTIFLPAEDLHTARPFLIRLTKLILEHSLGKIAQDPEVVRRHATYMEHAKRSADMVSKTGRLIAGGEVLLLDFSEMKIPPRFSRSYAYVVHPNVRAILAVNPIFQGQRRTNDLRVSMSLNPFIPNDGAPDLAAMFEDLRIGGGHPGAAGGRITAESKEARLRMLTEVLGEIEKIWQQNKCK